MQALNHLEPTSVFNYFNEICKIPHGSKNTQRIADYCQNFAQKFGLDFLRDNNNNVIIFKKGTKGLEGAAPIILQGHLDMVCATDEYSNIDFLRDGLNLQIDGDFIKATGTTLGADNGIAVAIMLSILESDEIAHPPIEAVFTADEEIGMVGALALDTTPLKAKRMINIDSEEDDTLTVSCAGGSDLTVKIPICRQTVYGVKVLLKLKGLNGGHSGIEIHKGRVNAAKLTAKVINQIKSEGFWIIDAFSGDKANAIPNSCSINLCAKDGETLKTALSNCLKTIKDDIISDEPNFTYEITVGEEGTHKVLSNDDFDNFLYATLETPNGVQKMSEEIKGLVETSLNLGILKIEKDFTFLHTTLRSNKPDCLKDLEGSLIALFSKIDCELEVFGHYPAWEYRPHSKLQEIYIDCYKNQYATEPKVEAVHAGLECGVFCSKIADLDCISIGPSIFDVHTPNEKLSISSLQNTYKLLLSILENCG